MRQKPLICPLHLRQFIRLRKILMENLGSIIEKMISGYHLIQWLRCEDRLSIDGMITRMGYSSKIARQSLVTAARSVISSSG